VSLDGQFLTKATGLNSKATVLQFFRTKSTQVKGIVLLIPSAKAKNSNFKSEETGAVTFLNTEGFDVAELEFPVSQGIQNSNSNLMDALKAYRLLKANEKVFGLHGNSFNVLGLLSGGHLAARLVQKLNEMEQPEQLILISPSHMDEIINGTVFPSAMPPVHPHSRLFVSFFKNEKSIWIHSGQEYLKTWKGYDGETSFHLLTDSVSFSGKNFNAFSPEFELHDLLKAFVESKQGKQIETINPAAVAVEGYAKQRHEEKLQLVSKNKYDLIFIGNSITNNFEKPEYQPVWNQFFAPRNALNLGTSGYRTENLIWNIQHGELDGQSPKVVVLEIGTNNVDEKNYPTRHTAGQLAGGIEAIVKLLREKLPDTKIIVLRCFPGCYGGPNPTSHRAILERASDIVSKLADGKHVFYCDITHVFLNLDGSINHAMMGDWLHPTPAGAKAWAQAMEPLLSGLMGDTSFDTELPVNTAIIPVPKLENDSYDWWARHNEVLNIKDSINPEIVLIGNSITHFWGGVPELKNIDGTRRNPNGPKTWDALFHNYRVLNLGFGWDRTQNVLWRLDHGELDRLHPRTVIINIGTNNTSQTENARMNTAPEIVAGIRAICMRVRSKVPTARIVLMAVFPREQFANHPRRILINEINKQLEVFAKENKIDFVDIGPKMVTSDGSLSRDMASDFCHPTEKGYKIWADAIKPFVEEP